MTEESPALYVVPTPLGNLTDITHRAVEVLRQVAWIAAEDTRHSAPLLRHYSSNARLLPAHEHNEEAAARQVIARLQAGESVALISDAGTPGISDPGSRWAAGIYEGPTAAAVRLYQAAKRLAVDGLVGPITWEAMGL